MQDLNDEEVRDKGIRFYSRLPCHFKPLQDQTYTVATCCKNS